MNKIEKYTQLLQEILVESDKEKTNPNSVWGEHIELVKREMSELLECAKKGEVCSKYKAKNGMLRSGTTYFMSDTLKPVGKTPLGIKIIELQQIFEKL